MIHKDELSVNANGGTEMMKRWLQKTIDDDLLNKVQIIVSREREFLPDMPAVFWAHDLADDPEAEKALGSGRWNRYAKVVCVSHWQKEKYIDRFSIPHSKITVIPNTIEPFKDFDIFDKFDDLSPIRLIYHTTPHRGLQLLIPTFEALSKEYDIHLNVFSSFAAYGWKERDKPYQDLFEKIDKHKKMTYYGYQPNDVIRDHLKKSHIFAYPNIWQETFGISLLEAMSSKTLIVAPNLAAIPETTKNCAVLYDYHENPNEHIKVFYSTLKATIDNILNKTYTAQTMTLAKHMADSMSENVVAAHWDYLLRQIT